jgi:hypothetical protein
VLLIVPIAGDTWLILDKKTDRFLMRMSLQLRCDSK